MSDFSVSADSRYQFAPLVQDDNGNFIWGNRQALQALSRPDDIFYIVTESERIDNIAYATYGNPALWWIIADYNNIPFPMSLTAGTTLRMPSKEVVEMEILNS
jgi:nucleoid-associated protein YgaU